MHVRLRIGVALACLIAACGDGATEIPPDAGPDAVGIVCSREGSACYCSGDNETETPLDECSPATVDDGTCCAALDSTYCVCFAPIECGEYTDGSCTCRPGPPDTKAFVVDDCVPKAKEFCYLLHSDRGPRCTCSDQLGNPEFEVEMCDPSITDICGPATSSIATCT